MKIVKRDTLVALLGELDRRFGLEGQVFLIGETSQLAEGHRDWATEIHLCSNVSAENRAGFDSALTAAARALGVSVLDECPGEVIPIPDDHASRVRDLADPAPGLTLRVAHFDPYSVIFRFVARGSEPDYQLALNYVRNGWVKMETMDALLTKLLPRFTVETIAQDPAEFRRRYGGLIQMTRSETPGTHRATPV